MGGAQAHRLCPRAVVVPPRMSAYADASKAVFEVFERTTPLVEGLSIDEAFLDVRGLERISGSPTEIAARLRREVRERVGLPITVGVASTKFLAKVASAVAKPDGLLVVPPWRRARLSPPAPGGAAVGRGPGHRRQAARTEPGDRRAGSPARRGDPRFVPGPGGGPPPPRPRPQPRSPASARGPAPALDRAPSARSGAHRSRGMRWTPSSSGSSTASPAGCGRRGGSAARSRFGCASATSLERLGRRHLPRRPRRPRRSSPPREGCSPRPCR